MKSKKKTTSNLFQTNIGDPTPTRYKTLQ